MRTRYLAAFTLFAFLACASTFPYKYYGMDAVSYEGKLLGPTAAEDIPLSTCQPDDVQKGKCIVMLVSEYEAFRKDYEDLKLRLEACENP